MPSCNACNKENGEMRCAGCKSVFYCSKECQKAGWKSHKGMCKLVKKANEAADGFVKTVIAEGSDEAPKPSQKVFVNYKGTLVDGTQFDAGQGFSFHLGLGEVIQGWDNGVATMKKGEKAQFVIASGHAYGANGAPPRIPGNAPLVFEIELLDFADAELQRTGTNYL